MICLVDIGNTHTHVGLAESDSIRSHGEIKTAHWAISDAPAALDQFLHQAGNPSLEAAVICSVVPNATPFVEDYFRQKGIFCLELNSGAIRGVGIDYPEPHTIGADRLANAIAANQLYGAPSVVVDFGTAVTFDVVDARANYVGGIIAPGLAAMTDYLHEKTALLPRIKIEEVKGIIGKNTREAMLIGAVHGYRGLIRELLVELKKELQPRDFPVIATGGYAALMASRLPEIGHVAPLLTLQGLMLLWKFHNQSAFGSPKS
ncbi:MAG: type III pantothenate kinase [Verrucomicrobiales bacterium]